MLMTPPQIVDKMMANDCFSQWLGINIDIVEVGYCKLSMKVRKEMLNGFGLLHGGISYALADSALAFAANSLGSYAVSIESSISHHTKVESLEMIFAETNLIHQSNKLLNFYVNVSNEQKELLASFKGMCYIKNQIWK
jgi:acyl-CoA thioesterase